MGIVMSTESAEEPRIRTVKETGLTPYDQTRGKKGLPFNLQISVWYPVLDILE
jgi:hypothetical protein